MVAGLNKIWQLYLKRRFPYGYRLQQSRRFQPLSPRYTRILNCGGVEGLGLRDPWPHFVLDDLLPFELFRSVQSRLLKLNRDSFETKRDHAAQLRLRYLEDLDLAPFFLSAEVRKLLEGAARAKLRINKEVAFQLRQMTSESPALQAHIDYAEKPSLVALYYIAPGWSSACGGELVILKEKTTPWDAPFSKIVEPLENRLVLFMTNPGHWHAVRKVHGWERLTVVSEWHN